MQTEKSIDVSEFGQSEAPPYGSTNKKDFSQTQRLPGNYYGDEKPNL